MNASRLRQLVDALLDRDREHAVQQRLKELSAAIGNLAGNPQDQNIQKQLADALNKFADALGAMISSFEPTELQEMIEIGAGKFFTHDIISDIKSWLAENTLTPAVAQTKLAEFAKSRQQYLQTATQLQESLNKIGIQSQSLSEGTAEIGFLIPRNLFQNELTQLIKELAVINRIIRAFSEVSTGTVHPIEVREISTSDPLFFFGTDPVTIATLAGIVTWVIHNWKKVEEIRKLRSETQKNKSFTEDEIKKFFDKKIEASIETAVEEKIKELLPDPKRGRHGEQANDLRWALKSLFARIERGMEVEVRFLAPKETEEKKIEPPIAAAFETMKQSVPELSFPAAQTSPVLQLPPPEPEKKINPIKE